MWTADVQRSLKRLLQAIWPPPRVERKRTFPATAKTERAPLPVTEKAKERTFTAKAREAERDEPIGWFGYWMAHGGACLAYTYKYMEAHKHLLPDMAASYEWSEHFQGSGAAKLIDDDWSRSSLMVNRFAEWPCPAIVRGSPRFLGWEGHDPLDRNHRDSLRQSLYTFHTGIGSSGGIENYMKGRRHYGGITSDLRMELAGSMTTAKLHVKDDGRCYYRKMKFGKVEHDYPIFPARNVTAYINAIRPADHRVHNKTLDLGLPPLLPNNVNQLVCPPYWRQTEKLQRRWWKRICYWYYDCAYLIWCSEMVRLHHPVTSLAEVPTWWRLHATSWGVGVPTVEQVRGRRLFTHPDHQPKLILTDLPPDYVFRVLDLVKRRTPIPGSPGFCGGQIVSDEVTKDDKARYTRHMLDIPPEAGSVCPPVKLDDFFLATAANWSKGTTKATLEQNIIVPVVQVVCSTVGSMVGAGAISSVETALVNAMGTTAATVIMKIASVVLEKVFEVMRTADGDFDIQAGDVVGLVTDIVAEVGAGEGFDIKDFPDDLWNDLKNLGAPLEDFGDWSNISGKLYALQATLCSVRDNYGWNWLDEAYGGLGLSKGQLDIS